MLRTVRKGGGLGDGICQRSSNRSRRSSRSSRSSTIYASSPYDATVWSEKTFGLYLMDDETFKGAREIIWFALLGWRLKISHEAMDKDDDNERCKRHFSLWYATPIMYRKGPRLFFLKFDRSSIANVINSGIYLFTQLAHLIVAIAIRGWCCAIHAWLTASTVVYMYLFPNTQRYIDVTILLK